MYIDVFFSLSFLYDLTRCFVCTLNGFFSCFSFKQCVQCICNAIDRHDAEVYEEFYDNLVTCDIKSVDCLIGALLVEPNAVQRLKGDNICKTLYSLGGMETNFSYNKINHIIVDEVKMSTVEPRYSGHQWATKILPY